MSAACESAFAAAEMVGGSTDRWQRFYLDLPGTGGSPAVEPTSEAVLQAVRNTLAELIGTTPYLLIGHSYGGYLATGLSRRDPSLVAGMLLICCGLRIDPAGRDRSGVLPSLPQSGWLDGVPPELHQHFSEAVGHQTRAVADRIVAVLGRRARLDHDYLAVLRAKGYRLDDEPDRASSFSRPVTLLAGRRDRIAGYRDSVSAFTHYPNGRVTVLADAGHYLPFEQPESSAAAILDWLPRT